MALGDHCEPHPIVPRHFEHALVSLVVLKDHIQASAKGRVVWCQGKSDSQRPAYSRIFGYGHLRHLKAEPPAGVTPEAVTTHVIRALPKGVGIESGAAAPAGFPA